MKEKGFGISFSENPTLRLVARFYSTASLKNEKILGKIFERENFKAEKNTACYIAEWKGGKRPKAKLDFPQAFQQKRLLAIGLGDEKLFGIDTLRQAVGFSIKSARARKAQELSIELPKIMHEKFSIDAFAYAAAEASVLANYVFDKYKTVETDRLKKLKKLELAGKISSSGKQNCLQAQKICDIVNDARFLVDESSCIATPSYLSKYIFSELRKSKVKVTLLNENQIKKLKMNLILAVSRAAEIPPVVVVAEYNGNPKSKEKTLFVGKGITYDTGGLDLKPGDSMMTMRSDMAGAAAVFGLMKSLAETKAKTNVAGVMIFVENLIDTKAYRNGDTLVSMKGLTVEVGSTDAEGRLILADGLYYGVKKFNPTNVVEYSTLTGSARATFGEHFAAVVSNNDSLAIKMYEAGQQTYERVWQLPLTEEYMNELKSEIADLRSTAKLRFNGAIYGGAFLSKFVEEKPFVHVDIAPTAFLENNEKPYFTKGATGFGIRLGLEFLKKL